MFSLYSHGILGVFITGCSWICESGISQTSAIFTTWDCTHLSLNKSTPQKHPKLFSKVAAGHAPPVGTLARERPPGDWYEARHSAALTPRDPSYFHGFAMTNLLIPPCSCGQVLQLTFSVTRHVIFACRGINFGNAFKRSTLWGSKFYHEVLETRHHLQDTDMRVRLCCGNAN